MRILICDDDVIIQQELTKYLSEYFHRHNLRLPDICRFHTGHDLLMDSGNKDIVFLDVEMPGLSGISVGTSLKKSNPNAIIFIVTSYSEYLDDAMRFHVFRYLSKPIDKQRLFRNLKDALSLYHSLHIRIPVETRQGIYSIPAANIVCVEADQRKVIIHTTTDHFLSVHTIQYWIQTLTMNCFIQTHRSYIVNMAHITHFDHQLIYFDINLTAYLTRRKYRVFKEAYLLYLESIQ